MARDDQITPPAAPCSDQGASKSHARQQTIFDLILEQTHDGICLQDLDGRIEWTNPACEDMYGWKLDEVKGRRSLEFILPPGKKPTAREVENFRYDAEAPVFGRSVIREHIRRDGSRFWNQQSFAMIALGPGTDQKKVVITCRDVSEQVNTESALRQVQANLEQAAYHDNLTGLANRKRLHEFLETKQVQTAITRQTIGVLVVDIDKFKDINDTLGHAAGDATLRHVADALCANAAPNDLICRTGGDEFLLICLDVGSQSTLVKRAELLIDAIGAPMAWKDQRIRIGSSIGASMAEIANTNGEVLIRQADQALYSAKNGGRGQVVFYTENLGRRYKDQQQLARDLRIALTDQQFVVHLQPQLMLASNLVTGCEALIRWQHPERGLLAPGEFLGPAEKLGLLADIDLISMNLALDALVVLRQSGFADMCMSINVSSSILADVNYPDLLNWALQSRGLPADCICVEILETTILEGGDLDIFTAVEKLKRLGVRIALDDFGTGYAGLAHMSTFEIDAIKLDRSMIARLSSDTRNRVIIRSIIRLCGLLGMQVIAEGVETNDQLDILRRARCPLIQGFGLARPMALGQAIDWLEANTPFEINFDFDEVKPAAPVPLRIQG